MESKRTQFILEERTRKEKMRPEDIKEQRLERALALKRNWKSNWKTGRTRSEGELDIENTELSTTTTEFPPSKSPNCIGKQPLPRTFTPSKVNNLPPSKPSQRPPSKTGGAGEQPEPLPPTITNLTT